MADIGSLLRKTRCCEKTRTVSDKPRRCGNAPPAMIALIESALAPGKHLRVQATETAGLMLCAESTIAFVVVAIPPAISRSVCPTFHPECSALAEPSATRICAPAVTAVPESMQRLTEAPAIDRILAASSQQATIMSC